MDAQWPTGDLAGRLADAQSRIDGFAARYPLRFHFHWRETRFDGRADLTERGTARIRLLGDLGVVPFTGEAPARRRRLLELAAWREGGGDARFVVSGRHRLGLLASGEARSTGAACVMAEAVRLALEAAPYLDLAREIRAG
ncbi:MAG: hypothetical protein KIT20_14115 [Alphaproteobacteria bacterium]|nr:hypothetical protein [Alphaproteobacteria bacterium]